MFFFRFVLQWVLLLYSEKIYTHCFLLLFHLWNPWILFCDGCQGEVDDKATKATTIYSESVINMGFPEIWRTLKKKKKHNETAYEQINTIISYNLRLTTVFNYMFLKSGSRNLQLSFEISISQHLL